MTTREPQENVLDYLNSAPARMVDIRRACGTDAESIVDDLLTSGKVRYFTWALSQVRHYYRVGLPTVENWLTGDKVTYQREGCVAHTGTIVGCFRGKAIVAVNGQNPENVLPFRLREVEADSKTKG